MILVGNARGHGQNLARHLLNLEDNDHVDVHEVRGFMADDLSGAFAEAEGLCKATRAKHYLFSLSLNPPADADASIDQFEDAVDRAERALGLQGQPRAIVFHEKEGPDGLVRRHAHAVWSRINGETMKAIPHPHFKRRLNALAKELYLENGWDMPQGFISSADKSANTFGLVEAQQAQSSGHDPKKLKILFKDAWQNARNADDFRQALKPYGFDIARGDRRGFVLVDKDQATYAVSRWVDVKSRAVAAKLGAAGHFASIEATRKHLGAAVTNRTQTYEQDVWSVKQRRSTRAKSARQHLVQQQRKERLQLLEAQAERAQQRREALQTSKPRGLKRIFDWIVGSVRDLQNTVQRTEAKASEIDKVELQRMVVRQLDDRRNATTVLTIPRTQRRGKSATPENVADRFVRRMGRKTPGEHGLGRET